MGEKERKKAGAKEEAGAIVVKSKLRVCKEGEQSDLLHESNKKSDAAPHSSTSFVAPLIALIFSFPSSRTMNTDISPQRVRERERERKRERVYG